MRQHEAGASAADPGGGGGALSWRTPLPALLEIRASGVRGACADRG